MIGPPRTGTSWLYQVLCGHLLLPKPTKETRFFDVNFHRGVDWYCDHYPSSTSNRYIGEVAPTYFASALARQRIRHLLPEAKIICTFRNPVQRVLSLYRVKRAYGLIPWNFEQAIERDPELMASGMYATNLRAWQSEFGKESVLATVYDDLEEKPQRYLDTLLDFIGAPRLVPTQSQVKRIHSSETMTHPRNYYWTRSATTLAEWLKTRRLHKLVASVRNSPLRKLFLGSGAAFSEVSAEVTSTVYKLFRPEIEDLETILNRDLSAWKSLAGSLQS